MDAESTIGGTLLGAVITGVAGALARIFGTPKERAEADALESAAHLRVAEVATVALEEQREDTKRIRVERDLAFNERDSCQDALRKMDARLRASEADRALCEERADEQEAQNKAQEEQNAWMERALNAVVAGEPMPPRPKNESTPPRNPSPRLVRAALAPVVFVDEKTFRANQRAYMELATPKRVVNVLDAEGDIIISMGGPIVEAKEE